VSDPVYIDKTARVTTSIGFLISIVTIAILATQSKSSDEAFHTAIDVRVSSVERRLQIYIDRNNTTHGNLSSTDEEIHAAIELIREVWAAEHGERIP